MKMKLLLRKTHPAVKAWDEELTRDIKVAWGELITQLSEADTIFFPRATFSNREDLEEPILVGFGDGSLNGFMAMVYVVWKSKRGGFEVFLVLAKARVAPLGGTSTLRMEMSLASLLARLMLLVTRN